MRPQLTSEFIKLTSTRTVYGLVAGAVAVVCLSTWSTVSSAGASRLSGQVHSQSFFLLASVNLAVFAVVLGVRASTDEYRFGTIIASVVADGRRGRLLAAKAVVAGIGGAVLATVAQGVMLALALSLTTVAGGSLQVSATDVAAIAGLSAASGLWAAIGVGVGALVRHQVAAVVGVIIWALVVENLGSGLLGSAGRFLPGQAAHGMAGLPGSLDVPVASAVLVTYTAAVLVAASLSMARRDL